MLDVMLTAAAGLGLVVAATFAGLQRRSISPPLLALVVGVLVGPEVLDLVSVPGPEQTSVMHTASRLLLAVALMAVALRYPITEVRRRIRAVSLLVGVVLPGMAAIVAGLGVWLLDLPVGLAVLLGAVLSPTDPVLASGIVNGELAERAIAARDRQILSLESGANDGLAMPLVILGIALAAGRDLGGELAVALYEIAAGVALGVAAGYLAAKAMRWAERHREIESAARTLYTLVLALFVLGAGGMIRADGLLGVFVAGLAYSTRVTANDRRVEAEIDEAMNQFLVLPVFALFGAVLPWREWAGMGWPGLAFVVAVLLLRRLPLVLALRAPLGLGGAAATWLGWFGPIGVAALFYLGHADAEGVEDASLWAAGTLVVAASTVAHGLTAAPGRLVYRRTT